MKLRVSHFGLILTAVLLGATFCHAHFTLAGNDTIAQNKTILAPNKSIERDLSATESHVYHATLDADQYLQLEVDQHGIDVVITILDPDGKKISRLDTASGTIGTERVSLISSRTGTYRFEIEAVEKRAISGSYVIRAEAPRAATDQDRALFRSQSLFSEAQQLSRKGDDKSLHLALDKYRESLTFIKSTGNRFAEANVLTSIGELHFRVSEVREALEAFQSALSLAQQIPDRKIEADALNSIGAINADSEPQKTLDYCTRALKIYEALSDRLGEAAALTYIGIGYSRLSDSKKAFEFQTKALPIWRSVGQREGEANTLLSLGGAYYESNEYQKALDYLNQALVLSQDAGDLRLQAGALGSIGTVQMSLGDYSKALKSLNDALSVAQQAGDLQSQAISDLTIATIYENTGDNRLAIKYLDQAIEINRTLGNKSGGADALAIKGQIYMELAENQNSLKASLAAAQLYREAGNKRDEAAAMVTVAQIYINEGQYQTALDSYNQVLPVFQQSGYRRGEAVVNNDYGHLYTELGEYNKALEYLERGLKLGQAMGDQENESTSLNNIGVVYYRLHDNPKAIATYNQSLALLRKLGDRQGVASTLTNVGVSYFDLRNYRKALNYYYQALPLNRTTGDRRGEAHTQTKIGEALAASGRKQEALEYLIRALNIRRAIADRDGEAITLKLIADVERDLNRLEDARAHLEASLKIVDFQRTQVRSQDLRGSYLASRFEFYESYVDLLMKMHRRQPFAGLDSLALEASERGRARSLLDLLIEARAGIREGVDSGLRAREQSLQELLNDKIQRQIRLLSSKHTAEHASEAAKEIERIKDEYQQTEVEIKAKSPRYAALTQPSPLTLKQIQQLLDENTLMLEYSIGQRRSYLWAVTRSSISSHELPNRKYIEAVAKQLYKALSAPPQRSINRLLTRVNTQPQDDRLTKFGGILSRILLAPVASQFGTKRLVIVADGILHYVPFGALPSPTKPLEIPRKDQPLIVQHEIVNLPSASALLILRGELEGRKRMEKSVAVIADPVFEKDDERVRSRKIEQKGPSEIEQPQLVAERTRKAIVQTGISQSEFTIPRLPGTRVEAEAILRLSPADARLKALDFAANKMMAKSPELGQYRYVHFATHGFLNTVDPMLSGILLSLIDEQGNPQDGFLLADEVFNLHLPVDLVVLSACQTGLGKEIRGEGLVGLTRGFMYAGAPRVIVSLWTVNDKATSTMMIRLYEGLLEQNLPPAAALRAAQIKMLRDSHWQHPYFWSAFVLQGEWK